MAMNIGICENDAKDREQIRNICQTILDEQGALAEIIEYDCGEKLLEEDKELELLLLDIEMPGIDGIQIKKQYQRQNKKTMILFVTCHDECMQSAFGMQVFGFIQKKSLEVHMREILPAALQILQSFLMIDGRIDSRQVVYISSEHIYSKLYLADGSEKLLRETLGNLETMLAPVSFIRIHKSYLVNAVWIRKWHEKEVETDFGKLPCSVRMRKSAKQNYDRFCMEHAGY